MGLFGKVGGFIKGLFSGSSGGGSLSGGSRSNTTYEPDKLKVAEIESDTKIRLAGMENDRIELMKEARLEILQYETESRIALEQAKAQGLAVMAQTIIAMQDKLNEIAEKRLLIIEKGSLQIIKEIESFYDELGTKIQEDNDRYNTEKLPELLSILERYEEGTPTYKLYMKRIEEDISLQAKYYTMQIDSISKRQSQIIDGFLQGKEHIIQQTGQVTTEMLEAIQSQMLVLEQHPMERGYLGNKLEVLEQEKLTLPENI